MTSIGRRCTGGNVLSRAILITRTLSGQDTLLISAKAEAQGQNKDTEDKRQATRHASTSGQVQRVRQIDLDSASDTASAMTPFHPIQVQQGEQTATASDKRTKAAIARGFHLFPFRTEKLNPAAPMVLRKWESR